MTRRETAPSAMHHPFDQRLRSILGMYLNGYFPMAQSHDEPLQWFHVDERSLIPLDARFHLSRSLARSVLSGKFRITVDQCAGDVTRACADRESTWINDEYLRMYDAFIRLGIAHSVEAWEGDELVGGLYGVAFGAIFMGESMFSRANDASKICLVHLVHRLRSTGFEILDSQILNEHIAQFGAYEVPHEEFLWMLAAAAGKKRDFNAKIPPLTSDILRNFRDSKQSP